ncbi:RUN and FYVE domain-containing protein 2 [Drosophila suzukii]|uniref:RUN and FYVE domain-containing protein 2 n=1 Tax=Drosophila suzukii TaxID=28584 RepID=A0AB39Z9X8_DROSZ
MEDQKPISVKMEYDSILVGDEDTVSRNRGGIERMKRADLIAELRREQMRTQSMVKRKDELKAALLQCNKRMTDTKRSAEELERRIQLLMCHNRELASEKDGLATERDGLLRQLQEELTKCEALRQQVLEQDLSKNTIVESILQENAAQTANLRTEISDLSDQRDLFHEKLHEVGGKLCSAEEKLERIQDENNCSICLTPWEAEGSHRMVSLKCGHLFGDSCIRQHLSRVGDCPYCKQPVQCRDIRYIFGCQTLRPAHPARPGEAAHQEQDARQAQAAHQCGTVPAHAAPSGQAAYQPRNAHQAQAQTPEQALAADQAQAVRQAQAAMAQAAHQAAAAEQYSGALQAPAALPPQRYPQAHAYPPPHCVRRDRQGQANPPSAFVRIRPPEPQAHSSRHREHQAHSSRHH